MNSWMRFLITLVVALIGLEIQAQSSRYDEQIAIGNGLYKVKSHERWGIVDSNDNLKLSLEYQEPLFMNGKAVIVDYSTKQLAGVIDSLGNFTQLPQYYINASYPFVTDDMLAVKDGLNGKWGYIDVNTGKLITVNISGFKSKNKMLKSLGITGKGIKGSFVFDFVAPFEEGFAAVYAEKTGWHHIDKTGQERFKDSGAEPKPTLFHSNVHNGECVIFNDKGIVLCKETPDHKAGIVRYIDGNYELKDYHKGLSYPYVIKTNNSKLFLNMKFQADKYENYTTGDSVIFIERPKIIQVAKVEEVDSFNISTDLKVSLSKKSVSAGAKGTAAVTVSIANIGEMDSDSLKISVDVKGTTKNWSGVIPKGANQQITLYVPAKFSTASIVRDVTWTIVNGKQETKGSDKVTIKRYKPSKR